MQRLPTGTVTFLFSRTCLTRSKRATRALHVCLMGLAGLAATAGETERAARLWGAAKSVRESLGNQPAPPQRALEDAVALAAFGANDR